jgi:hypothetical protein
MILIYKYISQAALVKRGTKAADCAPFISSHDVKFVDYNRNGG